MGSLVAMRYRIPMSMTAASSPTRGPTTTRGCLVWCLSKIACSVSARSLPMGRDCMLAGSIHAMSRCSTTTPAADRVTNVSARAGRGAIFAGEAEEQRNGPSVGLRPNRLEPAEARLAKRDPEDEAPIDFGPDHVDAGRKIGRRAVQQGVSRRGVDLGRSADVEPEVRHVAEHHASRRTGERAAQADERAVLHRG